MKRQVHHHKYERMKWPNGRAFYKCMIDNCAHYLPFDSLAIGRESLCWGASCNRLVTITKEDVQRSILHPMCEDCKIARQEQREALREIV